MAVPFVLELLFRKRKFLDFFKNALLYGAMYGVPIVLIDSLYFGTFTVAALNIIRYNVFTSHGPDLYGVEPIMFYVKNLFLNHNITLLLSLSYPLVVLTAACLGVRNTKNRLSPMQGLWLMSPLYLWLFVFAIQPHKEERFVNNDIIGFLSRSSFNIFLFLKIHFPRLSLICTWNSTANGSTVFPHATHPRCRTLLLSESSNGFRRPGSGTLSRCIANAGHVDVLPCTDERAE